MEYILYFISLISQLKILTSFSIFFIGKISIYSCLNDGFELTIKFSLKMAQ